MNWRSLTYFLAALCVSVVAHAGLALIWQPEAPQVHDERAAGDLGLLAVAGDLSDAFGAPAEETGETAKILEPEDASEAKSAKAETLTPEAAQAPAITREAAPAGALPAQVATLPPVEPEAEELQPLSEPAVPAAKPAVKKSDKTKAAKKRRKKATKNASGKQTKKLRNSAKRKQPGKTTRKKAGRGRQAARAGQRGRSSKSAGTANLSSYLGRVVSRVKRQKRYPASARRKKRSGTAIVAFTITRSGSATGIRLRKRSGTSALDKEALAMVRRAAPFGPIPPGRSRLSLTIPIRFNAR